MGIYLLEGQPKDAHAHTTKCRHRWRLIKWLLEIKHKRYIGYVRFIFLLQRPFNLFWQKMAWGPKIDKFAFPMCGSRSVSGLLLLGIVCGLHATPSTSVYNAWYVWSHLCACFTSWCQLRYHKLDKMPGQCRRTTTQWRRRLPVFDRQQSSRSWHFCELLDYHHLSIYFINSDLNIDPRLTMLQLEPHIVSRVTMYKPKGLCWRGAGRKLLRDGSHHSLSAAKSWDEQLAGPSSWQTLKRCKIMCRLFNAGLEKFQSQDLIHVGVPLCTWSLASGLLILLDSRWLKVGLEQTDASFTLSQAGRMPSIRDSCPAGPCVSNGLILFCCLDAWEEPQEKQSFIKYDINKNGTLDFQADADFFNMSVCMLIKTIQSF